MYHRFYLSPNAGWPLSRHLHTIHRYATEKNWPDFTCARSFCKARPYVPIWRYLNLDIVLYVGPRDVFGYFVLCSPTSGRHNSVDTHYGGFALSGTDDLHLYLGIREAATFYRTVYSRGRNFDRAVEREPLRGVDEFGNLHPPSFPAARRRPLSLDLLIPTS